MGPEGETNAGPHFPPNAESWEKTLKTVQFLSFFDLRPEFECLM
jgi:hypothetical protein